MAQASVTELGYNQTLSGRNHDDQEGFVPEIMRTEKYAPSKSISLSVIPAYEKVTDFGAEHFVAFSDFQVVVGVCRVTCSDYDLI